LKYEPHAFDTTVLRRALERVIERNAQKHRPMSDLKEVYCGWGRHQGLEPRPARYKAEVEANPFFGHCLCGSLGLYFHKRWYCQNHKPERWV
jgi:hypothetical protein